MVMSITLLTACGTVQDTSGKTLGTVETTVDGAMKGWASWVVAGHTTPTQEAQVQVAYAEYQAAYQVASTAWITAVNNKDTTTMNQIVAQLTADAQPLETLITSLEGGVK